MSESFSHRLQRAGQQFEEFTIDVIYERRVDRGARIYGGFLRFLSWIFTVIVKARNYLYSKRILHDSHLGCQVIVVGNLTVGGTGKTPVVEKLARSLHERGRRVAILSRGYKSRKEPFYRKWWRALTHKEPDPPKIVSDGENIRLSVNEAGDEPYMLARNLPGVMVLVDKDRVKAGMYAIRQFACDTLILDDGFQYFKLKDHLQLLMVDKSNPFGNGSLLPRGILREPVDHMRRASYVFLTKSNGVANPALESLIQQKRPGTDLIECTHQPKYLMSLDGKEKRELVDLKGQKVAAFCGIATPESFEQFLNDLGAEITFSRWFIDHHWFSPEELKKITDSSVASGAQWIITTEKDAVRISPDVPSSLPLYYLRVEIEILSGVKDFEEAVSRICFQPQDIRSSRSPFRSKGLA